MGYLHEGHLTLLRRARKAADIVILTLFVNPTQFGPKEDLDKYPRDMKGDLAKARSVGTDYVFAPQPFDMYPDGYETYVDVLHATQHLCGAARLGHFRGVTTVVAKLFNITQPDVAFFGMKDFQQYTVIKRMVTDLNMPIKIVGVPTVREKDGLAMSSRNVYLSTEERQAALSLSQGLREVEQQIKKGNTKIDFLLNRLRKNILKEKITRIDYVQCMDADSIQPTQVYLRKRTLFAMAVFVGKTRLIDNLVI